MIRIYSRKKRSFTKTTSANTINYRYFCKVSPSPRHIMAKLSTPIRLILTSTVAVLVTHLSPVVFAEGSSPPQLFRAMPYQQKHHQTNTLNHSPLASPKESKSTIPHTTVDKTIDKIKMPISTNTTHQVIKAMPLTQQPKLKPPKTARKKTPLRTTTENWILDAQQNLWQMKRQRWSLLPKKSNPPLIQQR